MARAIRQLSLIALACAALTIWYAIRSVETDRDPTLSSEFFGSVEYVLAIVLVLSLLLLMLSLVILGIIAAIRRRQWRWLAAITAVALGTGAVLYKLTRENFVPQFTQQGGPGGLILPVLEALASRVTNLNNSNLSERSVIYWCVLALPLLILLLAYSIAAERADPSGDWQGRRSYIALGSVALALALIFGADQLFYGAWYQI
jgi:hypothetical protein